MNTYVFNFPPVRVVGQDKALPVPEPYDTWQMIKHKTLDEIFAPQLSKIRVTAVVDMPLVAGAQGEETDEQTADGASVRPDADGLLGHDRGRGGHELQVDADHGHTCSCGSLCGK